MDVVRLARLTTALTVVGGGLVAGHILLPHRPGAPALAAVGFWAIVVALGALRGWREGAVLDEPLARRQRRAAAYALAAAILAWLANALVHGG